jgi:hypothetical protein
VEWLPEAEHAGRLPRPTTRPLHPGLPQDPVPRQACMRAAAFSLGFNQIVEA